MQLIFKVNMMVVACMFLAAIAAAWDPVRPGALVRKVGDMIIVNQSVRILLKLENVTYVRDNLDIIKESLNTVTSSLKENDLKNERLEKKMLMIQEKVVDLENNFLKTRSKRGIAIVAAVSVFAGLGLANLGLYADLSSRVNTLEYSFSKVEQLQETTDDIQASIDDIADNLENVSIKTSIVRESLDIFMLLDQIYIKILELHSSTEQLIQDLVLANTGSVTSTLLPIPKLIKIINTAKEEWNFQPFFDPENVALYYPLLKSYLNGTSVIIDIPFSSELKFNIFKLIPFPMKFNGSTLEVDTPVVNSLNYVLSIDSLKESVLMNDDLWHCKKTNLNMYLCPATYFTLNEALSKSCAASLVKNISIVDNCNFKEVIPTSKHETVQEAHYLYFPNKTTASVICPGLSPRIASVEGLYSVPDQCELHSNTLTTIANRKKTVEITRDTMLIDINVRLPTPEPALKIKRIVKNNVKAQIGQSWYTLMFIPLLMVLVLIVPTIIYISRKVKQLPRVVKHISATP